MCLDIIYGSKLVTKKAVCGQITGIMEIWKCNAIVFRNPVNYQCTGKLCVSELTLNAGYVFEECLIWEEVWFNCIN